MTELNRVLIQEIKSKFEQLKSLFEEEIIIAKIIPEHIKFGFDALNERWKFEFIPKVSNLIEEIDKNKTSLDDKKLEMLNIYLDSLIENLKNIADVILTGNEVSYDISPKFINALYDLLNIGIIFKYKKIEEEFIYDSKIYSNIKSLYLEFDSTKIIYNFLHSNKNTNLNKEEILNSLEKIYFELVVNNSLTTAKKLEDKVLFDINQDSKINEFNNYKELLEEKLKTLNDIQDTIEEKIKKANEASLIGVNHELLKGYDSEVTKIDRKARRLAKYIIGIFSIIIGIMSIKLYLIYDYVFNKNTSYLPSIKDHYILFAIFSFIISLVALLTYFIKERSRLLKLHDHFNLNKLELIALPKYMGEFDSNSRIELYKALAQNYFRGAYPNKDEKNDLNTNVTTIKSVADLLKTINSSGSTK
ncbi:hypothetical protein [Acinetobacter baumannii]|uniref:hypothetical protein n=1 Tax=Acinetobacter baumannii TaxID=470 RepID=UPI001EE7D50F|nr:hypothetical protein [Acinetobacter baumannii]MCG5790317.1 hypothetical protein [Acinetobacter baumannii]